jgi:hypothetical protein
VPRPVRALLSADESATLREQLIGDLNRLQSSEDAADWVHRNLAVKNTLMAADADSVEASFRERVLTLEAGPAVAEGQRDHAKDDDVEPPGRQAFIETMDASAAAQIILPQEPAGRRRRRVAAKTIRLRDREHCRYLTTQPCVVCGRTPSEAHTFASPSRVRLAARSATNTPFQSAGSITANCTAMVMRPMMGRSQHRPATRRP